MTDFIHQVEIIFPCEAPEQGPDFSSGGVWGFYSFTTA